MEQWKDTKSRTRWTKLSEKRPKTGPVNKVIIRQGIHSFIGYLDNIDGNLIWYNKSLGCIPASYEDEWIPLILII